MRKNRVIEQNRCYHLVSRLAHRAFFLDDEEKDRAVALMRRVEAGVQVSMSYCINSAVSISSDPFAPPLRGRSHLLCLVTHMCSRRDVLQNGIIFLIMKSWYEIRKNAAEFSKRWKTASKMNKCFAILSCFMIVGCRIPLQPIPGPGREGMLYCYTKDYHVRELPFCLLGKSLAASK